MASESKTAIIAVIIGNLAIAVTKFAAAAFTGSAATLSEAIHSVVDTGNGGLMLLAEGCVAGIAPAAIIRPSVQSSYSGNHTLETEYILVQMASLRAGRNTFVRQMVLPLPAFLS